MKIDKTKLQIIEKPENITHEQIEDLLNKAHDSNPNVDYSTADLKEEAFNETLKLGGSVFVALYEGSLTGTMMINIEERHNWYAKGKKHASCRYLGVLPEYSRNGIASRLLEAIIEWAGKNKVETIFWTPASNNYASIALAEKHGFHKVDFYKRKDLNHSTVRLVKYLSSDSVSAFRCLSNFYLRKFNYSLGKFIGKIKYKIKHR